MAVDHDSAGTSARTDSQTTTTDTSPGIPADQFQAILDKLELLRREVLNLPHEILIPPERHDNRQRYAMHLVLDYALAAVTGDDTPMPPLAEAIQGLNSRERWEIERDNAADAELLKTFAEFEDAEKVFLTAPEADQGAANDSVTAAATKLSGMTAYTLPGLAAKLKVLANDADTLNGPDWTEALIRGVAADAERLAMTGRAAA